MKRWAALVWVALVAVHWAAAPHPARAQEVDYGSLVVRVLPTLPAGKLHGYHELAFELTSLSQAPQRVTLRAPQESGRGTTTTLERLERSVVLPAAGRARLVLHQPALRWAGGYVVVEIDGREQRQPLEVASPHPLPWTAAGGGRVAPRVLLARGVRDLTDSPLFPEDVVVFAETTLPLAEWSPHWLAYSGWDGIVLDRQGALDAPAAVVEALVVYVETGGTLWILGSTDGDPGHPERRDSDSARAPESGSEKVTETLLARRWPLGDCGDSGRLRRCGVGLGWLMLSARPADGVGSTDDIPQAWGDSMAPWVQTLEPNLPHTLVPVVDEAGVPVRLLFLLLVGFTLVVGPLNVILLTRRGRRPWILATIPAISLGACGLLLLASLFGEGLVRQRRLEGFTYLDQITQRATSYAWAGFYSTLVPRDGLLFDGQTEVSPFLDSRNWRLARKRPGKQLVWNGAEEQHLVRGWLRARVPSYLLLRKSEPRRERLEVRVGPGGLSVVNGLGSDLERLVLADELGRLWGIDQLPAGERAELEDRGALAAGQRGALHQLYRDELPSRLQRLATQPGTVLRPGTYLAALGSSPFLEPGLEADAEENLWLVGRWRWPGETAGSSVVATTAVGSTP